MQIYMASREQDGFRDSLALTSSLSELPTVSDCNDPVAFGVHPAATLDGGRVPPYIERDIDGDLVSLLRPGSFVLLVGDSTAGKTRCAYEALRANYSEFTLFSPESSAEFAHGVSSLQGQRLAIWLDDIERFLSPPAITGRMIDDVLKNGGLILATIRSEQLSMVSPRMMPEANSHVQANLRNARGVISRSHSIYIDRRWSNAEIGRVRESNDPRLQDAVQHSSEVGIAEYLAAGPQLMLEWQNAWAPGLNPRGAALVATAVDLKRIGVSTPIPRSALEELHGEYLERRGGSRLRPESISEAFHWATQPLHATSSLLLPAGNDSFTAFDYLPDYLARDSKAPDPTGFIWEYALNALSPEAVHFMGHRAEELGQLEIANRAYTQSAQAGSDGGSFHLGYFAARRGEIGEAEYWYRKAIDQGSVFAATNLAGILHDTGRENEARKFLYVAVERGDKIAAQNLVTSFIDEKEWSTAEEYFTSLLGSHSSTAKLALGSLFLAREDHSKAWEWLNSAVLDGESEAYFYLGRLHEIRGDLDAAEESYEIAISHGFVRAKNNLATMFYRDGRLDDAERIYRDVFDSDLVAAFNLAVILARTGRESEAERLYQRCIDQEDSSGAKTNLALLMMKQGRNIEAKALLFAAAQAGDGSAMTSLACTLRLEGSVREAQVWCSKAVETGIPRAFTEMGLIQETLGNRQAAMFWYKRGVDLGDLNASVCLGYLLERIGKTRNAVRLYEEAGSSGDSHAFYHLGYFYARRGNWPKAKNAFEVAYSRGEDVAAEFADVLRRLGEDDMARKVISSSKSAEAAPVEPPEG
ncbi:tetratricopeptide repeat protein [Kitasatospora sp. NPDC058263]